MGGSFRVWVDTVCVDCEQCEPYGTTPKEVNLPILHRGQRNHSQEEFIEFNSFSLYLYEDLRIYRLSRPPRQILVGV